MPVDSNLYIHDSDRAALNALKAIPGFTPLLKAYMKVWNEQLFRIQNMATNLRISEKQMKKYYDMLPPICEKLGIEVPELYLTLDVNPNAYTYGDTKPFIVVTSGLIETMPEELIPTVLAHECGHIACHHVLYRTMGTMILNETMSLLELNGLISIPIKAAFYYWMRCSEYSADRAAAICDGTADKIVQMCMRFSGYDKDFETEGSVEAFMEQAVEYNRMMADSKLNKAMELMMFYKADHPLNAVRAYECNNWAKTEQFNRVVNYLKQGEEALEGAVPVTHSPKHYVSRPYEEVEAEFRAAGFKNIELEIDGSKELKELLIKPGEVMRVSINGDENFEKGWYDCDCAVRIVYYRPMK